MNPGLGAEGAKVAGSVVDVLKREPISLVLVVMNMLFLLVFYLTIHEVSASASRRDMLLSDVAKACLAK